MASLRCSVMRTVAAQPYERCPIMTLICDHLRTYETHYAEPRQPSQDSIPAGHWALRFEIFGMHM